MKIVTVLAPRKFAVRSTVRGAGLLLFAAMVVACSTEPTATIERELILDTMIAVTAYDASQQVVESIFERVREIEAKMSTSEEDYRTTELLQVKRAAGAAPVTVSEDTFHVVWEAVRYSELTNGRFDVTVGPLVDLWGIGTEGEQVPEPDAIATALEAIAYQDLVTDASALTLYLPREGMAVDVGGIAKGYAADEAAWLLREAGVTSALLDFGGNILTIGRKPDGTPWRIGVQVPKTNAPRGQFLGIAEVEDRTVVTSGTYERYFIEDGIRYHHILDTQTGFPVRNELDGVTIITDESMRADALSTALFAMGLEEGLSFAESFPELEAIFVTTDGLVYQTSGADDYFTLTHPEYTLAVR